MKQLEKRLDKILTNKMTEEFKQYETIKEEYIKELEKNNKQHSEELKQKGNEFMKNLKFKKAISCYKEAISANPENYILYTNM